MSSDARATTVGRDELSQEPRNGGRHASRGRPLRYAPLLFAETNDWAKWRRKRAAEKKKKRTNEGRLTMAKVKKKSEIKE